VWTGRLFVQQDVEVKKEKEGTKDTKGEDKQRRSSLVYLFLWGSSNRIESLLVGHQLDRGLDLQLALREMRAALAHNKLRLIIMVI
jgi:hypothetical protein